MRLVAQGATVELFDRWEPTFYQALRTVHFGDWWAEALGVDWAPRAFEDE